MLGALYGDIVGSRYEFKGGLAPKGFTLFHQDCKCTDDSLMTLAVADALVACRSDMSHYERTLCDSMRRIAHLHPNVGWGSKFHEWLFDFEVPAPINSYGNGAGMRIAPVGWVRDTLEETKELSYRTTVVSHSHPEGLKGAEAVAVCVYLARTGHSKEEIKEAAVSYYPEIRDMTFAGLKASGYGLDPFGSWITCQGSIPQAIVCFLDSDSLEDAVRKAVYLAADTDTQACMAGAIAEAYYGLSYEDEDNVMAYVPKDLQSICFAFRSIQKKRVKR
ncbi:MAG: ADP-ribosylglycohydrolase family protein [Bacilli bacterium]|nr:ADP-ribosylglycohydrolase family protein [Bacilli bacterium]